MKLFPFQDNISGGQWQAANITSKSLLLIKVIGAISLSFINKEFGPDQWCLALLFWFGKAGGPLGAE